jgi:hypothetical protein
MQKLFAKATGFICDPVALAKPELKQKVRII